MHYPPAPWTLKGEATFGVKLVAVERVRAFVPAQMHIVRVLPGRTVGGIYLASYGADSALQYHELIVFPGLVRHNGRIGAWISHIYVDNRESVEGGREIWGLSKELAEFRGGLGTAMEVGREGQRLCSAVVKEPLPLWRQAFVGAAFGRKESYLRFQCRGAARVGLGGVRWSVPEESPFATLGLDRPLVTFRLSKLAFTAETPEAA